MIYLFLRLFVEHIKKSSTFFKFKFDMLHNVSVLNEVIHLLIEPSNQCLWNTETCSKKATKIACFFFCHIHVIDEVLNKPKRYILTRALAGCVTPHKQRFLSFIFVCS